MKKFGFAIFAILLAGAGCSFQADDVVVGEVVEDAGMPVPGEMMDDEVEVEDMMDEDEMMDDGDEGEDEAVDESGDGEDDSVPATNVVNMNSGNFYFEPASITAKAGEKVQVNVLTNGGVHDFTIDEIGFKAKVTAGDSFTFTAPTEPGAYAFYCSVGNHRAMGMEGVLIVE